ncbi:MAG: FIST signal transduction protein [Hyphomicrobium sp.]
MRLFKVAHAAAEDWAHAAQACVNGLGDAARACNLGFVYITDHFAENVTSILHYLREKTGVQRWVGCVGIGICADGSRYFDQPALAVMVASFPKDAFCVFPAISRDLDQLPSEQREWIAKMSPSFGIVHGDPDNPKTPGLIKQLALRTSGFLVGGLTSSRNAHHQIAGRLTGGGLSGILFAPDVAVQTGLTQGCIPVGPSHVISDCVDNVLIGLDGRRALDVFKEDIGELLAKDLSRVAGYIHAALPLAGCDTGDYMVRSLIGIDPVHGWLGIGERMEPGSRILFVKRDPATAREDLKTMLDKLKNRLAAPARGGLYFSCVARGSGMFGTPDQEMAIIRDRLGDVPLVGFSCGGEISNGRLYGYTGVLALFS